MPYKVREIELGDIFLATKILKKVDLRAMVKDVGLVDVTGKSGDDKINISKEKGVEVIIYLLSRADESEREILMLLASWTGATIEEVKKIKKSEIAKLVSEFVEINSLSGISDFFENAVQGYMKQKQ